MFSKFFVEFCKFFFRIFWFNLKKNNEIVDDNIGINLYIDIIKFEIRYVINKEK